jgi:hypothetical protein
MPGKYRSAAQSKYSTGSGVQSIVLFPGPGPTPAWLRVSALPAVCTASQNIEFCYELGTHYTRTGLIYGSDRAGYRTSPALGRVSHMVAFAFGDL